MDIQHNSQQQSHTPMTPWRLEETFLPVARVMLAEMPEVRVAYFQPGRTPCRRWPGRSARA
jgi:hypothetical protein